MNTILKNFNATLELVDGDRGAAAQLVLAAVLRESCHDQPMTVPEVAKHLRVRPDKVLSWIRSGRLRGYDVAEKEGGRPRYRVNPADLEAFVQSRMEVKPARKGRPPGRRIPKIERPTLD
jgi:excisionase family DNA binding protein